MSRRKSFALALFAAAGLLGETAGSALAQYAVEWSGGGPVDLGGLPGATYSIANGINDVGQAVGSSAAPTLSTPSSGAADTLSIWAASQAPSTASPAASTTRGRW
jgi:uncharacterized membrane protein